MPYDLSACGLVTVSTSRFVACALGSHIFGNPNVSNDGTVIIGTVVNGTALSLTDGAAAHTYFKFNTTCGSVIESDSRLTFITTGACNALVLTGGNAGIGTSSPSGYGHGGTNRILEIFNCNTSANAQSHIILTSGATTNPGSFGSITWAGSNYSSTNRAGIIAVSTETGATTIPQSFMQFYTSDGTSGILERMRITSTGNVGIGTGSPTMPLTFADALGGKILLNANSNNYSIGLAAGVVSVDASMKFTAGCSTPGDFTFYRGSTLSMIIACTGNVGIGTTSPSSRLDVSGADGRIQSRVDSSDGSTINVRPNAGKCGWISYTEDAVADRWGIGVKNGDAKLYFASGNVGSGGGTTRMVLDSNGKVGIGTTSGNGQLTVSVDQSSNNQHINIVGTQTSYSQEYSLGIPTSTKDLRIYDGTAGAVRFTLTCNGSIGIGTTSPSYRLHVNGTFYAAGSSIDYKEGICQYDTNSCLFMCLKPKTYQYKDEWKHLGKELKSETQIGLIAEEVAEVMPELAILVEEDDNKVVRNVDYEKLSIILLSEVQKLRREVDDLKHKQ